MASLRNLVDTAISSRSQRAYAGSSSSWRADVFTDNTRDTDYKPRRLVVMHYVTVMLGTGLDQFNRAIADDRFTVSLGHGSSSDQNGMNTLFRQLGVPYRYDRDAPRGPRYTWLGLERDPYGIWADVLTPRVNAAAHITWDRLNVPTTDTGTFPVSITGLPTLNETRTP